MRTSMPSSSCSSRASARSAGSPASTLPPGNSQYPAYTFPGGRCASRKRPSARSITAAATSITSGLFRVPAGPVARELIRHAPAARAALQRPLQRLFARLVAPLAAERLQPVLHDVEVLVLIERIERHPQSEALRERNLLLDRLAGMDLVADVLGLQVLRHILRHEVAAIRSRVNQQVFRRGRHRAVKHHLERDIAVLGAVEAQVVTE